MRRRFRNSCWLLLLLVSLAIRSVAGNPAQTALPKDPAKPTHLSACSHLFHSEAEASSSINEIGWSNKRPLVQAVLHLNATKSIIPPKIFGLAKKMGRKTIISPFYSRLLFPFHGSGRLLLRICP